MGLFDALIYLVRMYFSPLAHHLSNHDRQNVNATTILFCINTMGLLKLLISDGADNLKNVEKFSKQVFNIY